jgi:hypothetical protein
MPHWFTIILLLLASATVQPDITGEAGGSIRIDLRTYLSGSEEPRTPALCFSPDGSRAAVAVETQIQGETPSNRLLLVDLEAQAAEWLDTEGISPAPMLGMSWATDGASLLFGAMDSQPGRPEVVGPWNGGSVYEIDIHPDAVPRRVVGSRMPLVAWPKQSPDGRRLAYFDPDQSVIHIHDASGVLVLSIGSGSSPWTWTWAAEDTVLVATYTVALEAYALKWVEVPTSRVLSEVELHGRPVRVIVSTHNRGSLVIEQSGGIAGRPFVGIVFDADGQEKYRLDLPVLEQAVLDDSLRWMAYIDERGRCVVADFDSKVEETVLRGAATMAIHPVTEDLWILSTSGELESHTVLADGGA